MPCLLTCDYHMCSTCLSLWLDSSSRIKFYGQLVSIYNVINRLKKSAFRYDNFSMRQTWYLSWRPWTSEIVENHKKCQSVLVFSAWLESLNQVSENDRTTFDKLQNVLFHVVRSDFSYDVCVRQGSGLPSNPQILWKALDYPQMPRVCARFHWYIPPIITGFSSRYSFT